MLDFMRRQAQGWIVKVLFAVIVLSFALWGVGDYFSGQSEVVVAEVGDQTITKRGLDRRVQSQSERMRQAFGGRFDPDQIDPDRLRSSVLRQMIRERLLELEARRLGLTATNEAVRASIRSEPSFRRGGQFSTEVYRRILSRSGLGAPDYEALVRRDLAIGHLRGFAQEATLVGEAEVWTAFRREHEKRRLRYFRVAASGLADKVELSEEDVRAHYEEHRERYRRPARVRVRYVILAPEALMGQFEPTEEQLRQYLEANAAGYAEGKDKAPALADVREEVVADWRREKAVDRIYERLPTFKDLLYTRDNLKTAAEEFGLEIKTSPWIPEKGGFPVAIPQADEFRQQAFRVTEGRNSAAIELEDGRFAGLHPVERQPSQVRPFEEVRDRVRQDLRRQQARELAQKVAAEARQAVAGGEELAARARQLGTEVESTDPLTRSQAQSQLPSGLAGEAFSLTKGGTGLARISRSELAVVEVSAVIPPERTALTAQQRDQLQKELRRRRGEARMEGVLDHLSKRYQVDIRREVGGGGAP